MIFDPENKIVQLCAQGMVLEGEGHAARASEVFLEAWEASTNDFEKFTAAHYVARHQPNINDKLQWDQAALNFALKINDDGIKLYYPSLYLNIAKCYEDLEAFDAARAHYQSAASYLDLLPEDGYGKMISTGVNNGLRRVAVI